MKTTLSLTCAATLLLSFALPGDQVRFAVKEKTKLTKVFDDKAKLHSTSFHMTVDGQDVGEQVAGIKISIEETTHVSVTDSYGALKDGRPSKVTRSYEKLGGSSLQKVELPEGMGDDESPDAEKERTSELEGKTVVFKLDDDGESYKADFADGKGDAKLLEKLDEDMDLRGLLPHGDVSEDKSWEIDPKVFNSVLGSPGGDLKINIKDDKDDESDIDQQFEDNLKGKGKGTYKGKRDVDGHKCAVIALEAELKTDGKADRSEDGIETVSLEYKVEGELYWDVEEGHFYKCTLTSQIKMTIQNKVAMEEKHEMERTIEFEGEGEFKAALGD